MEGEGGETGGKVKGVNRIPKKKGVRLVQVSKASQKEGKNRPITM